MLQKLGIILSLLLTFIIFLRIPEESRGLSSFTGKIDLLGSPNSVRETFDLLIAIEIILYLSIAFKLNLEPK
jgi:hypothetical protein